MDNSNKFQNSTNLSQEESTDKLYLHLPDNTRKLLQEWVYNGVKPIDISVQDSNPSITFLTADLKLPENNSVKILELNGVGSRLDAYPYGAKEPVVRIYQLINSLGLPVSILNPSADMTDLFAGENRGIKKYLMGAFGDETATKFGVHISEDENLFKRENNLPSAHLTDLINAEGVVWSHLYQPDVDISRFLVINPIEITSIANDKLTFRNFCVDQDLNQVRPGSWIISKKTAKEDVERVLESNPQIERFILKPTRLTGGLGMTLIHRKDLLNTILSLATRFDQEEEGLKILHSDDLFGWSKDKLILEEYVESKSILHENLLYDGTMRIAVITIVNKGILTVVPSCAYWKLPHTPIESGWTRESTISSVHQESPSELVTDSDFKAAFSGLIQLLSKLVPLANSNQDSKL